MNTFLENKNQELLDKSNQFQWEYHRNFLTHSRFRPLFDKAFGRTLRENVSHCFDPNLNVKDQFLFEFNSWILSSKLNQVKGLEHFTDRDFIIGVTHSLDDLHISFSTSLVGFEKCYPYHRRMKPHFTLRSLNDLQSGDVLVFEIPFAWYGSVHPETSQILERCYELGVPVHVDASWYGCLRGFQFDYNHPAIQSVSFSLSKGLGLGSHRVGVRYSRKRHAGPVSIINDFSMEISSLMSVGIKMMQVFGSDYLQLRYGDAYQIVCEKLKLRPTNAIHTAFDEIEPNVWQPVGVRSFLRYLVDDYDEFK